MPLPTAGMIGLQAGASILGSIFGDDAAEERERAIVNAMAASDTSYRTADEYLQPRARQEQSAISRLNALLGLTDMPVDFDLFRDTPGYEFMQDEARRQIERSAAGRGGVVSGNTLTALQERSMGLADQTFQNYLLNIMGVAGQGVDMTRANNEINRGATNANLLMGQGEARASGVEEVGNALLGGLRGAAGIWGQNYGQNKLLPKFDSAAI